MARNSQKYFNFLYGFSIYEDDHAI